MSIFVDKKPVAVTIDGVNIIYIRPRMGYGVEQKVIGAATKIAPGSKGEDGKTSEGKIDINVGAYNFALLVNNIMSWEGPEFQGMPCDEASISLLNDDEPLVELVLKEIAERNQTKEEAKTAEAPSPNSPSDGETGLRVLPQIAREDMTSTSSA